MRVEQRLAPFVVASLADMGHDAKLVQEYSMGNRQGILRNGETGMIVGGADPRRMMYAVGWRVLTTLGSVKGLMSMDYL